jgi:hypothetical protein
MLKNTDKIIFTGVFFLLLFLAFNRHSKDRLFTYHTELWADKAGYHMYLPALFYYDFKASNYPEDFGSNIGNGFRFNPKEDKVISKYPIGVAVLQSPFFTLGHFIDQFNERGECQKSYAGYSWIQHKMIDVSTVFYFVFGLLLLFKVLIRNNARRQVYVLLFLLTFGSNAYFYITRDAGLSHAYSFFTFSAFLYFFNRLINQSKSIKTEVIMLLFVASLGCLIRPVNVLFYGLSALVFIIPNWSYLIQHKRVIGTSVLLALPIALLLPFLQLVYYKYAHGSYLAYSYTDEAFIYADTPKFARVWFAPANGLLPYSPVFALSLIGIFFMFKSDLKLALTYVILFLGVSYLYAAWWTPGLGCGYGHRGFIEHLPFFALPAMITLRKIRSRWLISILASLGLVYIGFLIAFQYRYDGCWYGNGYWDWLEIGRIMSWW